VDQIALNVEREAKEKHEAEGYEAFVAARYALREERSRPIFKQFHGWLVAEAPKSLPENPNRSTHRSSAKINCPFNYTLGG
jgi:hypothetical protein